MGHGPDRLNGCMAQSVRAAASPIRTTRGWAGGTSENAPGHAIVPVFGLPSKHEDDPIRAVEAAAESQRALVTLNDELEKLWGVQLVNRTGGGTGIVHFGRDAE